MNSSHARRDPKPALAKSTCKRTVSAGPSSLFSTTLGRIELKTFPRPNISGRATATQSLSSGSIASLRLKRIRTERNKKLPRLSPGSLHHMSNKISRLDGPNKN
jgi:hypothetical protein